MAFVGGDAGGEVGSAPIEPGHLPPALAAAGAADAAHHLADAFMDARIGFSAGPVGGGDAGAVEPYGGRGDLFGALGEVGGDRGGIGWHELGAAVGCPAVPAFPAAVVDAAGVLGGGGFERGGDPGVIDGGDAGDLAPVDGGDGQEASGGAHTSNIR